jgi:hypothetical protein
MDDYDVESHSVADAHRNECSASKPTEGCLARPSSLDRSRFEIPADVAANLKKTSQSHGIEIAALLLAAFKWTLSRYSGHKEPGLRSKLVDLRLRVLDLYGPTETTI